MYLMYGLAQGNGREARRLYTLNAFRTVSFHTILSSRLLIEDCGKLAHSLSPVLVWGIRNLCARRKQMSTHWTDFKRHLLQILEQCQPKFLCFPLL